MSTRPDLAGSVLVAEDDDDLRDLIASELRVEGYRVIEARDGAELIERLDIAMNTEDDAPDLVITDIRMPRLSGFGVLSAIRRAGADMPVVVMTVFVEDSIRNTAERLGAAALLKKPFDMAALHAAITTARSAHARHAPPHA